MLNYNLEWRLGFICKQAICNGHYSTKQSAPH